MKECRVYVAHRALYGILVGERDGEREMERWRKRERKGEGCCFDAHRETHRRWGIGWVRGEKGDRKEGRETRGPNANG